MERDGSKFTPPLMHLYARIRRKNPRRHAIGKLAGRGLMNVEYLPKTIRI